MRIKNCGNTITIMDGKRGVFSLTKKRDGTYRVKASQDTALLFEGEVVSDEGWTSYAPGDTLCLATKGTIALTVLDPNCVEEIEVDTK